MRIVFQFEGGFLDGEIIAGDTDMQEPGDRARRYVSLTHGGRIGSRFRDKQLTCVDDSTAKLKAIHDSMKRLGIPKSMNKVFKLSYDDSGWPSRDTIQQWLTESVQQAKRAANAARLRELAGQIHVWFLSMRECEYEVVSRETIAEEIRVRVVLVGEEGK